jgi:hypothetical protein
MSRTATNKDLHEALKSLKRRPLWRRVKDRAHALGRSVLACAHIHCVQRFFETHNALKQNSKWRAFAAMDLS